MTQLPAEEILRDSLNSLLDIELALESSATPSTLIRSDGREGLVVATLVEDRSQAVDGYLSLTHRAAKRLAGLVLMTGEPTEPGAPMEDAALEAVGEIFNAVFGALSESGAPAHWVLGKPTVEPGAQALDPHLATARAVAAHRLHRDGEELGVLGLIMGPPVDHPDAP